MRRKRYIAEKAADEPSKKKAIKAVQSYLRKEGFMVENLDDTKFLELGDVDLECADGVKVKAHRSVLALRSPVFEAMFFGSNGGFLESKSNRVDLGDFSSETVKVFVRYLSTKTAPDSSRLNPDFFALHHKYDINMAINDLWRDFVSGQEMTPESCVHLLRTAKLLDLPLSFEDRNKLIGYFQKEALRSPDFVKKNSWIIADIIGGEKFTMRPDMKENRSDIDGRNCFEAVRTVLRSRLPLSLHDVYSYILRNPALMKTAEWGELVQEFPRVALDVFKPLGNFFGDVVTKDEVVKHVFEKMCRKRDPINHGQ